MKLILNYFEQTIQTIQNIHKALESNRNDTVYITWAMKNNPNERTAENARFLFQNLMNQPLSSFGLYGLQAWNFSCIGNKKETEALKQIDQSMKDLCQNSIKWLSSFDFFDWIKAQGKKQNSFFEFFFLNLKEELFNLSKDKKKTGKKIIETLGQSIDPQIDHMDMSQVYSTFQYLELFFLIEQLTQDQKSGTKKLVFILPNDEYKYYIHFPEDITYFQKYLSNPDNDQCLIEIEFYFYQYGKDIKNRPYDFSKKDQIMSPKDWIYKLQPSSHTSYNPFMFFDNPETRRQQVESLVESRSFYTSSIN